ncbi:MAG: IS91 family transposase [Endomicrobiales bacterium]
MEFVSGKVKLRDIFLHDGNWWKLFIKHRALIRTAIIINVLKLLACRTSFLGYHIYKCLTCGHINSAPHSCKSRFCPPCGKKATDIWIQTKFNTLPQTDWQHITFTMPRELWVFFWINRPLFNKVPILAADIIKQLSKDQGFLPGIFLAVHTFGRDLKRNFHIHLSTTAGGLSFRDNLGLWIYDAYFYHQSVKDMWRYKVITLFRSEFKKGSLKLPPELKHIKTYQAFSSWLNVLYNKQWVVELSKPSKNMKRNVEYLGKYLKRPPIGETRIISFIDNIVTFKYLDHYTKSTNTMSLPALDFIQRLIAHIPDSYFRNIRYYGFLSNRTSAELLPIANALLSSKPSPQIQKLSWRDMLIKNFNFDPLLCPVCKSTMIFFGRVTTGFKILSFHKEIANGHFQLV